MVDLSVGEMIMSSFSKIWHLIPIAIAIVLFKRFINQRDMKQKILKNEEHEKNGLTLEIRTRQKYEDMGYTVQEAQPKGQGIDLLMSKENKTLLIQCNNNTQSKSITQKDIKNFHKSAKEYVKTNNMEQNNMELRYVIPFSNVLHKSAIQILSNDAYGCKYVVV